MGNYYHLISEGVLSDVEGNPYEVMARGSLKRFYDSLDENEVFNIDLDHQYNASLFRQIGTWSKSDLKLVPSPENDGRYGLYVKLNLDEDNMFVKEMRRQDLPLALSVEFYSEGHYDTLTDDSGHEYDLYVHDDVDIVGFAVVSEPQDAYSGNIDINNTEKEAYSVKDEPKKFADVLRGLYDLDEEPEVEAEQTEEEVKAEAEPEAVEEPEAEEVSDEKDDIEPEPVAAEPEAEEVEEPVVEDKPELTMDDLMELLKPIVETSASQAKEVKALTKAVKAMQEHVDELNAFSVKTGTQVHTQSRRVGFQEVH